MDKSTALLEVRQKLEADAGKLPLTQVAQDTVPGEGNPEAQIMFIGEAAGFHESVARRPFVGLAGKLLNKCLEEIGITRESVYITNVLKVRPPANRDPEPAEIAAYAPYLDAEIDIIKPKIIATLGRFSMGKFLPEAKISQVHGQPRWVDYKTQKILILPLYHPAAALRAGNILQAFKADFAQIPQLLQTLNNPQPQPPEPQTPIEPHAQQLNLI